MIKLTKKRKPGDGVISHNKNRLIETIPFYEVGKVEYMHIAVDLEHQDLSDLVIKVKNPKGVEVLLHNRLKPELNKLKDVYNQDELTSFIGNDLRGNWTLIVEDQVREKEGILYSWSIGLVYTKTSPAEQLSVGQDEIPSALESNASSSENNIEAIANGQEEAATFYNIQEVTLPTSEGEDPLPTPTEDLKELFSSETTEVLTPFENNMANDSLSEEIVSVVEETSEEVANLIVDSANELENAPLSANIDTEISEASDIIEHPTIDAISDNIIPSVEEESIDTVERISNMDTPQEETQAEEPIINEQSTVEEDTSSTSSIDQLLEEVESGNSSIIALKNHHLVAMLGGKRVNLGKIEANLDESGNLLLELKRE